MTILDIVLVLVLLPSIVWNVVITGRAIKMDDALQRGGEGLENCLDEINKAYGTVGKILQSPLASNDPQIVRIHKELKRVHDGLLVIANRLVSSWNNETDEEDDEEDT
jgi:hypothetical protein